jgi:ubiquinone/menaquinone biosynthesis C-methylase UbiE
MEKGNLDEEWKSANHVQSYLSKADEIHHRVEEGEKTLLDQIPTDARRILDLGTGDGRLLAMIEQARPTAEGVALDFSKAMLKSARKRFANDKLVRVVEHDLNEPLPSEIGRFDAVVSSFAIHHLPNERKKELYGEIFDFLNPKGVFCNLEHTASPTASLHSRFLAAIGYTTETEDRSNLLLDVETQLRWFREIGFVDVDCFWKWLELALLVGFKDKRK